MTARCGAAFFVIAMFLSYGSIAKGTEEDTCKPLYQSVSDSPMVAASYAYEDRDNDRLKICGASPACSSCVEMASGDCRYVFPTYVMAYPRKNSDGAEEICACQVFACKLPWDPLGWSGRCMDGGELGCYAKPPNRSAGEFPESMCAGVDDSIRVKFVPMAFALQDYTKPGIRVIVYKGEKVIDKRYIFPKVNTFYEMSDNAVVKRLKKAVHARNDELATRMYESKSKGSDSNEYKTARKDFVWNIIYYSGNGGKKEDAEDALAVDGATHTYTARRGEDDNVCIKYYGASSKDKSLPLVNTCLPVPGLNLPTMYALSERLRGGADSILCNPTVEKTVKESLWQYLSLQYIADKKDLQCIGKISKPTYLYYRDSAGSQQRSGTAKEDCLLISGMTGDKAGRQFLGFQVWMSENIRKEWLKHGILLDYARSRCRVAGFPGGNNRGGGNPSLPACVYSDSMYSSMQVFPVDQPTVNDGIKEKKSGVVCAEGVLHRDIELEVIRECRYGEECASKVIPSGVVEGRLEQSTEALPRRYTSFRVRKKPKTLRRYVIVNYDGMDKRIRCDDKYSIDLHSVSQEVLDQSQVSNNKFVLPKSYLANSIGNDSEDPCVSSESNIVYYYEGGGFVAGNTDRGECGNPVEEYYAPGKKVTGCEYDYIRTDNYEPFLPGVSAASQVAAFPVGEYEQGLCVDGFEKSWFRPSYYTATVQNGTWGTVGTDTQTCCQWKNKNYGSGFPHTTTKQERNVYRYRLHNSTESTGGAGVCTLYRVEMWGGGESAATTELGLKRSGRPGQYTMVLLDYSKMYSKKAAYSMQGKVNNEQSVESLVSAVNGAGSHSLVFSIGEGGTPGSDTVLRLCSDKFWSQHQQQSLGKVVPWNEVFTDKKVTYGSTEKYLGNGYCYEIAKAVGGGSEKAGELQYNVATKDIVVYYKTIIGDVLQGDDSAQGLLEKGYAMFTKFPLEMNLGIEFKRTGVNDVDPIEGVMANQRFFEGRSLPKEFCKYKPDRNAQYWDESGLGVFMPGMGGCWSEKGERGVGENGAVMITCERWEKDSLQESAKK